MEHWFYTTLKLSHIATSMYNINSERNATAITITNVSSQDLWLL